MGCRDEVLVCAASLAGATTRGTFTIKDMINCMKSQGTLYAESTIPVSYTHLTLPTKRIV